MAEKSKTPKKCGPPASVLAVSKADGERARQWLGRRGLIDRTVKSRPAGGEVVFPLLRPLDDAERAHAQSQGWSERAPEGEFIERMGPPPIETILDGLARAGLSRGEVDAAPRRWENVGDVLILKLDGISPGMRRAAAAVYARVLGARAVLREAGFIAGELRRPDMELLFGGSTVTVHLENGVRFRLDPARVMFSSGNVDERIRMSTVARPGEHVVDLFAGIGYFTIPMAVHSRAARITACELNAESYAFLVENAAINGVRDRVEPRLGDCRDVAPRGVADRVLMGYMPREGGIFLDLAMDVLRPDGGAVHYHENVPLDRYPRRPLDAVSDAAGRHGFRVERATPRIVKSYAPSVVHCVVDAELRRSGN